MIGDIMKRLRTEPRRLFFPFLFPDRNELDEAQRQFRTTPTGGKIPLYAELKNTWTSAAAGYASRWRPAPWTGSVVVAAIWHMPSHRADLDNIASGGRKIIMDALGPGRSRGNRGWRGAGILHCDGRHCVDGLIDIGEVAGAGGGGVEIVIVPVWQP